MELQFFGANCLRVTTKTTSFVFDDNLASLGKKISIKPKDIDIYTSKSFETAADKGRFVIDSAGEYEIDNTSVIGIAARSHLAESEKDKSATIYKLIYEDVRLCVLGHIYPELSEAQLEAIGVVDVLVVPVGGNGFTLDPVGAAKMIRKIEPKMVVPTHFDSDGISYPVPQRDLETALKELALEIKPEVDRIKIKSGDFGDAAVSVQPLSVQ